MSIEIREEEGEETAVFESMEFVVTRNGTRLTFWELDDTRYIRRGGNEDDLRSIIEAEAATERSWVVVEPEGGCKIYREAMQVNVFRDIEAVIGAILQDLKAA